MDNLTNFNGNKSLTLNDYIIQSYGGGTEKKTAIVITNKDDLLNPIKTDKSNNNGIKNQVLPSASDTPKVSTFENTISTTSTFTSQNLLPVATTTSTVTGTTYYISPTGNDRNSGTSPTQAFRTIGKLNNMTFKPGDRILFQGGASFSGNLNFDVRDAGTATNPISISSYGTGVATINAGTGKGISVYNAGGYSISNLNIVGSGVSTNTSDGIGFYNDLANNIKLEYININNVKVSGFKNGGISIGSWNQSSGYRNVSITNSITHDNGRHGLVTYAQVANANENVYVGYVQAYNNFGIAGEYNPSGNGIVLGAVNTATIERSIAYNNGRNDNSGPGAVGIWAYDSNNITIQYNESYNNKTGSSWDGGGFDFDQNVSNSVMQYNYSHDNDGAGFLLCQSQNNLNFTGNTVRYNISQNDGRKNSFSGIEIYGKVLNTEIYNNTVFVNSATTGSPSALKIWNTGAETLDVSNVYIRNNIFQTVNGQKVVNVTASQLSGASGLLFQGNNYYSGGQPLKINWGSAIYDSLTNWQNASGQEKLASQNVGMSVDPLLVNPGGGGTINNTNNLNLLDAYKLGSSSPLINAGLNLNSTFGTNVGSQDFYGASLAQGVGYDIGAHEWR